ncbi:MAG: ATP-binding protein [Pseudomonadales bacterium]|nr:ATP-binding protein [Pseudomonadales bacterium]
MSAIPNKTTRDQTAQVLSQFTDSVALPVACLMQPIALIGGRESGKTYAGTLLFETAHDLGVQCGAIDIIGKWPALRRAGAGKALNDVVVFGGKYGDFPLLPTHGAFLAALVVQKRIHFVIDVSLWRKGDRRRFLADFLEELYLLKKQQELPTALLLFFEEAHALLPQKPQPDEARMLGAITDIIAEGRNCGIGCVIMDQRCARLNKDGLALVEVFIALRCNYKSDREAVSGWFQEKEKDENDQQLARDIMRKLPFLKPGNGYVFAPMFEVVGPIVVKQKRTHDATATVRIGGGPAAAKPGALSAVDVTELKAAMEQVTQEISEKDPHAMRAKLRELQKELETVRASKAAPAPKAGPAQKPIITVAVADRIEQLLLKTGEDLRAVKKEMDDLHGGFFAAVTKRMAPVEELMKVVRAAPAAEAFAKYDAQRIAALSRAPQLSYGAGVDVPKGNPLARSLALSGLSQVPATRAHEKPDGTPREAGALKAGARVMAGVLAAFPGGLTRHELGALSGFSSSSGTFSEYIQTLMRAGVVAQVSGGKYTSNAEPLIEDWPAVLARHRGHLKAGAVRMLEALIARRATRATPSTRHEVGELTGIGSSSGTFSEYINVLARRDLVELDRGHGQVWLADRIAELALL